MADGHLRKTVLKLSSQSRTPDTDAVYSDRPSTTLAAGRNDRNRSAHVIKSLGAGAAATLLPGSIAKALAIPAHNATGTIMDVEHVVILMQENRSFDHYFGTLRGVRGFNDPRAVTLPNGNPVWYQPTGVGNAYVAPFHPTTPVPGSNTAPDMGVTFIEDLDHGWQGTHLAWNYGQWDQWVPNKTATTMAHLTRADIPFHYALVHRQLRR